MDGILSNKELVNEIRQVSIATDVYNYKEPLTAEEICQVLANDFNTTPHELKGLKRKREIVLPRHLAMMFCKKYVFLTLKQTGKFFNRDHTTVINAINKLEWDREYDKKLNDKFCHYDKLFAQLKNL